MADLTITINESINLGSGRENNTQISTISGINQVVKKVDTISTFFSGSGVEILKFVDSESEQTAGSFVKDKVKYIRITNLDSDNLVKIYLIKTDEESMVFEIEAQKSIILNTPEIDASGELYVYDGYVDPDYFIGVAGSFIDTIKAKASGSDCQIEYFVASL